VDAKSYQQTLDIFITIWKQKTRNSMELIAPFPLMKIGRRQLQRLHQYFWKPWENFLQLTALFFTTSIVHGSDFKMDKREP
jgi:hypothetical protein